MAKVELRALLYRTAHDLGGAGFDFDYGWGALDPKSLLTALGSVSGAFPP